MGSGCDAIELWTILLRHGEVSKKCKIPKDFERVSNILTGSGVGSYPKWGAQCIHQGLRNEFQMKGANYFLMTLIQSKAVEFSIFLKNFLESQWVQMGNSEN